MTHRERFLSLMKGEPVDRVPVYYFGTWRETKTRWRDAGLAGVSDLIADAGPQLPEMDPDWEAGMWGCHGLVRCGPLGSLPAEVVGRDGSFLLKRDALGALVKESVDGSTVPEIIRPALEPSRESWRRFRAFLDPDDAQRRPAGWEKAAESCAAGDMVRSFMGGSLYGWFRNWMGIEAISFLVHDDPMLLEEMVDHVTRFFMRLMDPVLSRVRFDFKTVACRLRSSTLTKS